jgi:nucleoside-diphosphate-sugar epimerase
MRVLFLGATGIVGSQVVPELQNEHELTLAALGGGEVNGVPVKDVDITDLSSLERAVRAGSSDGEPFDAIVNCAIASHSHIDYNSPEQLHDYYEQCIDVNARGAYHVCEAAARAAVPCVIYISSMTAVLGPPRPERLDASTRDQPNDVYAASKVFGEHIGRYYAFRSPREGARVRTICLRLGQPYKSFNFWDSRWPTSPAQRGTTSDCRDVARAIDCALCSDIVYGVYTILSDSDYPLVAPELYSELGYNPGWKFTAEGLFPVEK